MEFRSRFRRSLSSGHYQDLEIKGDYRCGLALRTRCRNMRFIECPMDLINFSGSTFESCSFISCSLKGANFNACTFHDCHFVDCDMDLAGFKSAAIFQSEFIGGRAEYASWEDALVKEVIFDLQLHGADLRFSSTESLAMQDSNIWGAAIKASCKSFVGVSYSERLIYLFLGLLSRTRGNDNLRAKIRELIPASTADMIDVLTLAHEGE